MNVNREQQHTSAEVYSNLMQNGSLAGNSNVALNINNEAALAQSLHMVGNSTFDHGTLRALRAQVDAVQHPAGPIFTRYSDLNIHGRTTAADRRNTNNHLQGCALCDLESDGGAEQGEMTEERGGDGFNCNCAVIASSPLATRPNHIAVCNIIGIGVIYVYAEYKSNEDSCYSNAGT